MTKRRESGEEGERREWKREREEGEGRDGGKWG